MENVNNLVLPFMTSRQFILNNYSYRCVFTVNIGYDHCREQQLSQSQITTSPQFEAELHCTFEG